MSRFVLTDAAIERALAPGFEIAAPAGFVGQVADAIATHPRRSGWLVLHPATWPRQASLVAQLILLLVLLLTLAIGTLAIASLTRRGVANGHVIVAMGTELIDIDPTTASARTLLTSDGDIFGVARSGEGGLISFWTASGTTLEVVDSSGGNRRRVAANITPPPVGQGQIDVWSPDNRYLAAGVVAGGDNRILVVDVSSGTGELIGPPGAGNPLWSPDAKLLAFSYPDDGQSVLAVMRPDGSGLRKISGDLGDLNASGPNNWSPEGAWVYFGAERDGYDVSYIYRADVEGGGSEQLTFDMITAAPALSPDGTKVAYSSWERGVGIESLWLMDAAGANQRLLLASALNDGWSNDGQFLLAEWRPSGAAYELLVLRPDGPYRQTLMTFDGGCYAKCVDSLAWGQPRP